MNKAFLLGAAALTALSTQAPAATYTFSSGSFMPGTTAPSPLLTPDVLNIIGGSNKFFVSVNFTNQSGTVNWSNGSLFLQSGSTIDNQSLWNASFDGGIYDNGGATSTFTNSGTLRKSAGAGNLIVSSIAFVNSGTIDAQSGTILFNGGNATFNSGSSFTGAGRVVIDNNATFNGVQNTSNLRFTGATSTGNAASLNGAAAFASGRLSGDWTVTGGSTLTVTGGSNKFLVAAAIANNGTVAWNDGALFLQSGSSVTNQSVWDASFDGGIYDNGGALSTFTNNGTLRKSGGAGNLIVSSIAFENNGTIDAQSGTILFNGGNATFNSGSSFTGAGRVVIDNNATFNGAQNASNLRFTGGTVTGNAASLNGSATYVSGSMSGGWTIGGGSTLNVTGGANKFLIAATLVNNGTIAWDNGALFMQSGTQVTNNGTVQVSVSTGLHDNGGADSTFTNAATGLFQVNAGSTVQISDAFVNNGTLTANGTLRFSGGNAVFNNGGVMNGAGTVNIDSSAAFNGTQNASNLSFTGGTYTGTGAVLNGQASYSSGNFSGGWTIGNGSTLTMTSGSNKFLIAAAMTNNGTIAWNNGSLFMQSGTVLTNNGTITSTASTGVFNNGGEASQFINNGLIEKTAGAGTLTISNGIGFVNNGTINALSGTISLPSNFTNNGTLGGTATFSTNTLTNAGTIAPGAPGAVGTLQLTGNFVQAAAGALASQIAGTGSADLFNVSGTAALGGTLSLSCVFGCAIATGDSFVLLDSIGALTGTFANVTTTGFRTGFAYEVIYDRTNSLVRLNVLDAGTVNAVPEPATWAMMIAGFATVGSMSRRRRQRNAVLA